MFNMKYEIKMIEHKELGDVLKIYHSLLNTEGCSWSEDYPNAEDVIHDISNKSLYGVYVDEMLIAVANADRESELEDLDFWSAEINRFCDLARLAVVKEYQNCGIAKILIKYIEQDIGRKGFDGIRFLVWKQNYTAIKLYQSLGYERCGESSMYDLEWFCYQKKI